MLQGVIYSVAVLGFEEGERRLLRNVLAISEHRTPAFRAFAAAGGGQPQLVIINADKSDALRSWQRYHELHGARHRITPVFLSRVPMGGAGQYTLHRPILTSRLFQLLERVVIEAHDYQPAMAFAADTDPLLVFDHDNIAAVAAVASRPPAPPAPAPAPTAVATANPSLAAPTELVALVVDDSLPVRIQMKTALQGMAAHVDFAETGEAALELIERRKYSLIFLDVILPGKDGYEVCRRIRRHPLQQRTPVVMLTSNASPADRVKGKLAGCDTYLIKPVRQAVFDQVVSAFTTRSNAA